MQKQQFYDISASTCVQYYAFEIYIKFFKISLAENNIQLTYYKGIEAKTFPAHFPTGKHTMSEERNKKLKLAQSNFLHISF